MNPRTPGESSQAVVTDDGTATEPTASDPSNPAPPPGPSSLQPLGIVAPEWSLQRSARGAALWRHSGAMTVSAGETVEVLALDRDSQGRRFAVRDEWNVPAPDARFRVRRVAAGDRAATFDDYGRARLEGAVLDWVRERRPRLVHVLDLDAYGFGVLLALEAAEVASVLTLDRVDEIRQTHADRNLASTQRDALASVRRIVVRSAADAAVAESAGAPRSRIRVVNPGSGGEGAVLRAYASLYRHLAPAEDEITFSASA
ncbi:MAG: glycosyltransferase [Planctomycetota bacterium]